MKERDMVNSPSHYTSGDMETIDIIRHVIGSYNGFQALLAGNIVKYICRANFKGNKLQDLKKAKWYMDRLVKEEEETQKVKINLDLDSYLTKQKELSKEE